jgi:hypothetical protein
VESCGGPLRGDDDAVRDGDGDGVAVAVVAVAAPAVSVGGGDVPCDDSWCSWCRLWRWSAAGSTAWSTEAATRERAGGAASAAGSKPSAAGERFATHHQALTEQTA